MGKNMTRCANEGRTPKGVRAETLAAIDTAEASLARGDGRVITRQSMRDLAEEVKQRGWARITAEQRTTR